MDGRGPGADVGAGGRRGDGGAAGGARRGRGPSARGASDVTALLDAEQYEAISIGAEQPLLVLGSAGSGKTTVALHRLAQARLRGRGAYPQARMKVIVPEEGLARLSRRLLEPLGLSKVSVQTLDAWAYATARAAFGVPASSCPEETPAHRLAAQAPPGAAARCWRGASGTAQAASLTLKALRTRLADALHGSGRSCARWWPRRRGNCPPRRRGDGAAHHAPARHAAGQGARRAYDPEALETMDGRPSRSDTPDELAGTVDVEDLPLLMYLKTKHGQLGADRLAHVVLDEAEDFSLFELAVVGELLGESRSCTLAGDEMQQTTAELRGLAARRWRSWASRTRPPAGSRSPTAARGRSSSWRGSVLGTLARPRRRAGRARRARRWASTTSRTRRRRSSSSARRLRDLMEREPHASVAVIASSPEAARAFHGVVADMPWARLVLEGDFSFEPGVDVTDVDNIKGLEFDYVVLPDATAARLPAHGRGAPEAARGGDARLAPALGGVLGRALAAPPRGRVSRYGFGLASFGGAWDSRMAPPAALLA